MKASIGVIALVVLTFMFVNTLASSRIAPRTGETADMTSATFPFREELLQSGLLPSEIRLITQLSNEFSVDARLIFALIRQESQFDRYARSERGALGLMQIMPVTNSEMNDELHITESTTLKSHLSAGIYYFSKLLQLFPNAGPEDRVKLALAAYNAGPARVYDAQKLAAYLNGNPNSWNAIKNALPLLSKRYYSLHQSVWDESRPENGYFGSAHQTITFVENVVKFFDEYGSQVSR